jgi:hypothetical protein
MSENGKRSEEGPGTGVVVKTKPSQKYLKFSDQAISLSLSVG